MKFPLWGDRRSEDRRQDPAEKGGRRKGPRRKDQQRQFVRLYYPPTATPQILDSNFRTINISQGGILFTCHAPCSECSDPIKPGSTMDFTIRFQDGETYDVKVKIIRCLCDLESKENRISGAFVKSIPAERICKEQSYLLRNFREFCQSVIALAEANMELPSDSEEEAEPALAQQSD